MTSIPTRNWKEPTQLLAYSGYDYLMLCNMQWDIENPCRFNFKTVKGQNIGIIHATTIGAISRLLPVMVGQLLLPNNLNKQRYISPIVCPYQIDLLLLNTANAVLVNEIDRLFNKNSLVVNKIICKNLRKTLSKKNRFTDSWFCVLGEKENKICDIIVQNYHHDNTFTMQEYIDSISESNIKCTIDHKGERFDLPW